MLINYTNLTAGIDEAGRGPLCAPVYAACLIFNSEGFDLGIDDSKKLSEKKREKIYENIINLEEKGILKYGIGQGSVEEIDKINIRNTTKLAMKRAYEDLINKYKVKPELVLVDGNFIPDIDVKAEFVIKGDSKVLCIAGASIIAKVSRDKFLKQIHEEYPEYNWIKNKGYGTKEHFDAIKKYGLTKYHRKSFLREIDTLF